MIEQTKDRYIENIIESQKKWRAIIDAIMNYIFVIDDSGAIVRANKSFAQRFDKHPREILGANFYELFGSTNLDIRDMIKTSIKSGMPVSEEIKISDRTYILSIFPAMMKDKKEYICIMQDVTEIKRLRDQLYHSDKLISLGLLVSGIAHEINNPLTGIIGYTELLEMKVKDDSIISELKKIHVAAERCKKIVESLLCFARQQTPQKSFANINNIIESVLDLRAYRLRTHNIEVIKRFDSMIPFTYFDIQQMQQAIMNVIMNAEDAVLEKEGNSIITISTKYDKPQKRIIIEISDNGIGIEEKNLSKIFDPFFTTKPVNKGTGLGLSIAYSIVTEHGGKISAKSRKDEGTTFIIELPIILS
jgi:PAS domain S-box-containing protein